MHSFQYRKNAGTDIEQVITYRKKKIFRQQFVYALVLIVLVGMLGLYIFQKMLYTEFDGYVKTDVNMQRSPDDIIVTDIYVRIGDFVIPGDTLYSFYYLKPVLEDYNWNSESDVEVHSRELSLKYAQIKEEVAVLLVRIRDLEAQIAEEAHNISFGLSTNSHKMDLERELNRCRAELQEKRQSLGLVGTATEGLAGREPMALTHAIATDSAVVVNVNTPESSCVFRSEQIMALMPLNINKSNFTVLAYVPEEKVMKIKRNRDVTIMFNEEVTAKGRFALVGARTEDLPSNLKSSFMRQARVLIAGVDVLPDQDLPFWAYADQLPVRIRIPNIKFFARREDMRDIFKLWLTTGKGLSDDSQEYLDSVRHNAYKQMRERRIREGRE